MQTHSRDGQALGGGFGTILEGGQICDAFRIVQTRNALCPREQVPIEREGTVQYGVIRGLAEFYDQYNTLTDEQKRSIRERLGAVMRTTALRPQSCIFPRENPQPPIFTRKLMDRCIESYTVLQQTRPEVRQLELDLEKISRRPDPAMQEQAQRIRLNIFNLNRRITMAELDLERLGTVSERPGEGNKSPRLQCALKQTLLQDMTTNYYRILERQGATELPRLLREFEDRNRLTGVLTGKNQDDQTLSQTFADDAFDASQSACQNNQLAAGLSSADGLRQEFYLATDMCLDRSVFTGLALTGRTLVMEHSGFPTDAVINSIARLDQNFDDYLLGVIGPQCLQNINTPPTPDTRPRIPADLRCNETSFPLPTGEELNKHGVAPPPTPSPRTQGMTNETAFRTVIWDALSANRPVGISLCTAFFSNPEANSDFGRNCDASRLHAYHAMTITGRRCVNGEMQYQVLNSWGPTCAPYVPSSESASNANTAPPLYDCNEDGGYIWVPESVLLNNTKSLSVLETNP